MRWLRSTCAVVAVSILHLVGAATFASFAAAAFVDANGAGATVSSKRVFPTSQASSAWELQDSSSGTASSRSDSWATVDARRFTTATLTTAFSATRYVELTLHSPLPTEVPISAVTLNVTMAASGGGTGCIYAEIRRASTNALLGTHGSSTTPLACSSSTTQTTTISPLAYITSSTVADDLKVKVFLRSSSSQRIAFDRVTVTGDVYSTAFTLLETSVTNRSSGTATTTPWALATSDTRNYSPASAWTAAFAPGRHLEFAFPPLVPTDATITDVTLRHAYASATAAIQTCTYVEIYAGATLLASRGSATSPLSCNSTTTQVTDVIDLPEIDTAAELNALTVRVYVRNAAAGQSRHGLLTATTSYSLT
jgi:hypothetical protein